MHRPKDSLFSKGTEFLGRLVCLLTVLLLTGIFQLNNPIPAPHFGVNDSLVWATPDELERSFSLMNEAGIQIVRLNFAWKDVQRTPGPFDFSRLDAIVRVAALHHIQLLPILLDTPEWASSAPQALKDKYGDAAPVCRYHASNALDWLRYVWAIVAHFPTITYWEVWNEENLPAYWPDAASPVDYFNWLMLTDFAIRGANPTAKVVLGGLANADAHYLQSLYDLGAAPYFDVVSVHDYVSPKNGVGALRRGVRDVRSTMDLNNDRDKPLWLTEVGWSDNADVSTGQLEISLFLQQVYSDTLPVDAIFWYDFRDIDSTALDPENHFGLVYSDFSKKATFSAYWMAARYGSAMPDK